MPTYIDILTDSGTIVVKLYDETPLHKKNFLKVIKEGYYEKAIFHRVIKDFMIQGGESSENQSTYKNNELISSEIVDTIYNKRGALCAARTGDQVNPERMSSPVEFYIVQGKKLTDGQLFMVENNINNSNFSLYVNKIYIQLIDSFKNANLQIADSTLQQLTIEKARASYKPYKFNAKQREIYNSIGGAPHLDGQYTVFGEVVEGIEVVDKIATVAVGRGSRPIQEHKMRLRIK